MAGILDVSFVGLSLPVIDQCTVHILKFWCKWLVHVSYARCALLRGLFAIELSGYEYHAFMTLFVWVPVPATGVEWRCARPCRRDGTGLAVR